MDYNIESTISSITVLSGLVSTVLTIVTAYKAYMSEKAKLIQAQEQKFKSALESDDLITVGSFLYNTIGDFNIYEYVSNSNVSKTVDKFNEKLISFLKTNTEMAQEIKEIEQITKIEVPPIHPEDFTELPEEIKKVHNELDAGDIWNALARLRRYIEIILRKTAEINDIHIDKPTSAGYLLNILTQHNIVSKEVFNNLKYSITISNKAVHGLDVNINEAHEALFHAEIGLNMLRPNSGANLNIGMS